MGSNYSPLAVVAGDVAMTAGTIDVKDGGQVTQGTSTTTAVELNTHSGEITTFAQTLTAGLDLSFTLTNSAIDPADNIIISVKTYGGTADGIPIVKIQSIADGSCIINLHNQGAAALDALVVLSFVVIHGATS